jgi:hypothetical protein
MSNGILFVVFGEKYYNMALKTITYSRKFTELPFHVLTNIKNDGLLKITNLTQEYIGINTAMNRHIKTTMIRKSPFDKTIYLDVDSVIQNKGIESAFDLLDSHDIMLNLYGVWNDGAKVLSYYRKAMARLKTVLPLTIYYGAFIGFNKTEQAHEFFNNWNANWIKSEIPREMPALACTVKAMKHLNIKTIGSRDKIFSWIINRAAVIQHEYGHGFWGRYFPGGLN